MGEKGSKIQNKILEDENWNFEKNEKKERKEKISFFIHIKLKKLGLSLQR